MMSSLFAKFRRQLIGAGYALSLSAAMVLVGCGGGGGSESPVTVVSSKSVSCTTTINSGFTGDLSATYSPALTEGGGGSGSGGSGGGSSGGGAGAGGGEGKVLGGLMTITRLTDGKVLGSAVTDTTRGLVTIAPCGSDLPVLLTLSGQAGAEYYDEGTGKMTPFPAGTSLHALVDQFDENVGVSFLTEGAYQYALSNLAPSTGSLTGITLAQVQLANQTILTTINANLPKATQLVTLKSLPTPIDSGSSTNALLTDRYGIAEAVVGGMVTAAATAQPKSAAPALGLGMQLDADLTDGNINGLAISGAPAATGSNVYYTPAVLPTAILNGMGPVAQQFGAPTIVPLLKTTVTVSLSSTAIGIGQSSTLNWSTNNATACTASGSWSGVEPTSGSSVLTPTAAGSNTYILTCTGPTGSASAQAVLTVSAASTATAPTISISTNPTSITQGQSSTLVWSTVNAPSCVASNSWSGSQLINGSTTVTPSAAGLYTYALTCSGLGGSTTGQATVTVNPSSNTIPTSVPTVSISANPTAVTLGQSATLAWSTSNATSCTASGGWSGLQLVNGSIAVTPNAAGNIAYGLTCTGLGGSATGQAVLTVNASSASTTPAPTVSISASPTTTTQGQSTTLSWSTSNATACTANGNWSGSQAISGSTTVTPAAVGSYSYGLSCTGPSGSATGQATVKVNAPVSAPPSTPSVVVSVTPSSIMVGNTVIAGWTTNDVTECSVTSGNFGTFYAANSAPLQNSVIIPAANNVTPGVFSYALTCTGPQGSITGQTTLTVLPPAFSIAPATISLGQSAELTWNTAGVGGSNPECFPSDSNWSAVDGSSGSASVTPTSAGTYTYTISCQSSLFSGVTNQVQLTVTP